MTTIINTRRACAARLTVLSLSVRLSVCRPSVRPLPLFFHHALRSPRYKRVQRYTGLILKMAKRREIWRENKRKGQYANEYSPTCKPMQLIRTCVVGTRIFLDRSTHHTLGLHLFKIPIKVQACTTSQRMIASE